VSLFFFFSDDDDDMSITHYSPTEPLVTIYDTFYILYYIPNTICRPPPTLFLHPTASSSSVIIQQQQQSRARARSPSKLSSGFIFYSFHHITIGTGYVHLWLSSQLKSPTLYYYYCRWTRSQLLTPAAMTASVKLTK